MSEYPLLVPISEWIDQHPLLGPLLVGALLLVAGEILHRLVRHIFLRVLERAARRSALTWDDAFFLAGAPQRLTWGVPLLVWYQGISLIPGLPEETEVILRRVLLASIYLVLLRTFSACLDAVHQIYARYPRARERPIKGFLQVANVVAYLFGAVLIVTELADRDPLGFLAGMGAMTAVLLLVFRDTLLSLVAGIQITTNDHLRVGDWIEMPQFDADGDVVDIALNSVRVRNWDNTFSVIPTHKFLENSFRNWRGMQESGGRRIKRAFFIDQSSVRFLTDEEVNDYSTWELLSDYVFRKRTEIEEHNGKLQVGEKVRVPNRRRMTNVGMLRAYLVEYLKRHPAVHQEMTQLVRQLSPGPEGLPIEIYVFTSDIGWGNHEAIQADIFDHIFATVPDFGLRIFQSPSGADFREWLAGNDAGGQERNEPSGGAESAHPG